MLRDITESFSELKLSSIKLAESLRATKQNEDDIQTETDIKDEITSQTNLDWKLNLYIGTRNFLSKNDSSAEGKLVVDGSSVGEICKAVPLKISKPEAVKFSGQSRDFASFKRDFMAIIVPNRGDAEIGIHFKQGIPDKHKHLISNLDLCD